MARIRIDDKTEQKHLNDRKPKHDRERHSVPAHLNEFLDDHSQKSSRSKETFHDVKLSFEVSMRWMNASSSPAGTCFHSSPSLRYGAIASSSARGSEPLMCNELPKATACSIPGRPRSSCASFCKSGPDNDQVFKCV